MEQTIHGAEVWENKGTLSEFLKEPLNEKLYQVCLNIKRRSPSQDFQTLRLYNEVYRLCSQVVYENSKSPDLKDYISRIKEDMGWDYPTSVVLNMIYAVLSLRRGNSEEVIMFLDCIRKHYKMDERKNPFTNFVEEEQLQHHQYDIIAVDCSDHSFSPSKTGGSSERTLILKLEVDDSTKSNIQHRDIPFIYVQNATIEVLSPGNTIAKEIKYGEQR